VKTKREDGKRFSRSPFSVVIPPITVRNAAKARTAFSALAGVARLHRQLIESLLFDDREEDLSYRALGRFIFILTLLFVSVAKRYRLTKGGVGMIIATISMEMIAANLKATFSGLSG
jgi:hypothetical protein